MAEGRILVVDDERNMTEVLEIFLRNEGYSVQVADSGQEALEAMREDIFDLVITDMKMPGMSGIDLLKKIKQSNPETMVVIITAYGSTESAVQAMKSGAYDYILKPFSMEDIRLVVKNALETQKLRQDVSILRRQVNAPSIENIVGESRAIKDLFKLISKAASSNANILITGESGTGKELVARAIHNLSDRRDKHFVTVNCAAIPEGLMESELFGYMKGAFTGATSNKQGLFEVANGGTLFLDEIGEMSLPLQAKILRVLEDCTFRRVGGVTDVTVNVRVIAATNKDLLKLIDDGQFREDLYFRLNVLSIKMPPLRDRREDIPLLIHHFLRKFSDGRKEITPEAVKILQNYRWKGNVRELENVIERVVLLSDRDVIDFQDLPDEIRNYIAHDSIPLPSDGIDLEKLLRDTEKAYLLKALEEAGGVKTEAARLLNLTFRSFRHKLKKYGINQIRRYTA